MAKKRRKTKRKPLAKGALWGAEIAEAAAKAKRELEEYKRKLGLQLEGEARQRHREFEREHEREQREQAKQKTTAWTRDLSWESKPPPPEVIFMLIGGKPVRLRLVHQHNMPVYLPDIEELP